MNDHELIQEFISVEKTDDEILIRVKEISWPVPWEPVSKWVIGNGLSPNTPQEEIENEISRILKNPNFFSVCEECGERNPIAWMHGESLCQSCAERTLGVVY